MEAWLWKFIDLSTTKKALIEGLNRDSATFKLCRDAFYGAGQPLLERAVAHGDMRPGASIDDVMRLLGGMAGVAYTSEDQRERVLRLAMDGLRAGR